MGDTVIGRQQGETGSGEAARVWPALAIGLLAWAVLTAGACAPAPETPLTRRVYEARLSNGTRWAPCAAAPAQLEEVACAPRPSGIALTEAWTRSVRGEGEPVQREGSHRRALYDLYAGGDRALDRAVEGLREAAAGSDDPDVLHDLAVAHFARAHRRADAIELVRALGAVERARRLAPDAPAVLFNRALILDRLHLLSTARQAWTDYLDRDPDGPWAAEVEERLAALPRDPAAGDEPSHEAADRDPQAAREWLQREGFGGWARAAAEDRDAGRAVLADVTDRAAELGRVTGDDLLARTAAFIREAEDRGDSRSLERLIRGHRDHARGSALMQERRFGEAEPFLSSARRELGRAGSPFVGWVDFLLLRCAFQRQRYEEVEDRGRQILSAVGQGSASALRGRTWWVLGTARHGRGDLQAAGEAYRLAEAEFARLGERSNELAVRFMYAAVLESSGRLDEACRLYHQVLAGLRARPSADLRRLMAIFLAYSALDLEEPEAALALHGEAVAIARADGRPLPLANALMKQGGLRQRVGDLDGAAEDLAEAAQVVERIEDDGPRGVTRAQLRLEQGRLWRATAPERARAALDEALALHRERDIHLLVPEVRLEMARVQRALGEPEAAEGQLSACLDELDRQRLTVHTDWERIALADKAAEAYDELVDLLIERGRYRDALLVAERARARRLREWWANGDDERAALVTLDDLPDPEAGEAVVVFTVLPERLAVWVVTDAGMEHVAIPIAAPRLRREIHAAREAIRRADPEETARHLGKLHRLLVQPLGEALAGRSDLLLVPDEELYLVPFPALRDAATGRHLLEDHHVSLAPSLATDGPAAGTTGAGPPRSILLVADPAFDRAVHPLLPRLPGAEREGVAIAAEYPEVELLRGEDATADALLRQLGAHRVVHVAAHAVSNAEDPFRSFLVLAPGEDGSGGEVEAREVLRTDAPVPDLVVLAACGTVGTEVSRTEGALGLAWAFLARGTRSAVVTLWELDDAASERIFVPFHRLVAADLPASEALRRAQLEALQAGAPVRDWAAPVVFSLRNRVDGSGENSLDPTNVVFAPREESRPGSNLRGSRVGEGVHHERR